MRLGAKNVEKRVRLSARAVRERFDGITGMTLSRWVKAGILPPPVKIGNRNFWWADDVERLAEQGATRRPARQGGDA
jgi:predicted site-specific integrase-resolvase